MSGKTSKGKSLVRWFLTLGALVGLGVALWTAIRYSVTDAGAAKNPTVPAVILGVATLILLGVSARRTRDDLREYRRQHEGAAALAGAALKPGAVTGLAVRGLTRGAADLVDILAPVLAAVTGWATIGWVYEVTDWPGWAPWAAAGVLGAAAGLAIAARVGAVSGRPVKLRDVELQALPSGIVGMTALGGAAYWAAEQYGRIEQPAIAYGLVAGFIAGTLATSVTLAGIQVRRRHAIRGQLAAALNAPASEIDEGGPTRWRVDRHGGVRVRKGGGAATAKAAGDLDELDQRLAAYLPELMVDRERSGPGVGLVLVPVTGEVRAQRALLADTDGVVVGVEKLGNGTERWTLAATVSPAHAERVDALARRRGGLTLVDWRPFDREAVIGQMSEAELLVRQRAAELTRQQPWDLTVSVAGSPEREVDTVTIKGAAWPAGDARARAMRELISRLPGGNPGWVIDDQPAEGVVTMQWRKQPELPPTVPLASLLPQVMDAEDWANLPLGVGADGRPVGLDLTAGPHALIAGPTGSGKTVGLLTLVTGALARGHQLVVIDPTKAGLDFASLRPWCTAWAGDYPAARAAMEKVYAEVVRRKEVLKKHEEVKWSDLPAPVREAEGIAPLTVLIDEYGSLALEASTPKGLAKDDPLVTEAAALNASKAVIKELVGRVAREARFVGIHLQIALQRPDVAVMGSGELRSNLTSAVQLAPPGKGVSPDALRMLFHAEVVEAAAEQIAILDDGTSKGLAVVAAEGGSARALRVGYAPMRSIPELLEGLGVPQVAEPWDLVAGVDAASAAVGPREGELIEVIPDSEQVVEFDDLELGDIDLDDDEGGRGDAGAGQASPGEEPGATPGSGAAEEDLATSWGF